MGNMMTMYDIIQLIISVMSLISTIVISVVLYRLDRKREFQIEIHNEKIRQINLEHEADIFIINNGDEIEYLPLCVIANNINGTKKHKREIYNNFNLCTDELKMIILKKRNIFLREIKAENWFDECNDKLIDQISRLKLGRNMFYDNAKYVTRCFEYYSKKVIPNIDVEFSIPDYSVRDSEMLFRKVCTTDMYIYISRFFNYLEDINIYNNPQNIEMIPPCDYVYELAVDKDTETYCRLCTEQMRYLCSELRSLDLDSSICKSPYGAVVDIQPKYYEDLFYCAAYELYMTFGKEFMNK